MVIKRHIFKTVTWVMALCCSFSLGSAFSETIYVNPFVVENVEINLEGPSTQETRLKAISLAHRQAFHVLLTRLDPLDISDDFKNIKEGDLETLIQDVEVTQEKVSANHYKSLMIVRFNKQAVEKIQSLKGKSLSFEKSSQSGQGYLLIPLFEDFESLKIWEEENELFHFFKEHFLEYASFKITLPEGDLQDIKILPSEKAQALDLNAFVSLLERYKIPEGLVIKYRSQEGFLDIFRVTHNAIQPVFSEPIQKNELKQRLPIIFQDILGSSNSLSHTSQGMFETAEITFKTVSFNSWSQLQEALHHNPLVQEVRILSLTPYEIKAKVIVKGRDKTLRMLLPGMSIQGKWPQIIIETGVLRP